MVKAFNKGVIPNQSRADHCHRCGGLMVPEQVFEIGAVDWRCVSCGERVDSVILAHRQKHLAGTDG